VSSASSSTAGAVVVTGAAKGIGEATALHLDAKGFRVFAGVRTEADAAALRERGSDRLVPMLLEVTDEADIARAVETVKQSGPFEQLALVNNAAVSSPGPLEFVPVSEVRAHFEVNVLGALAVTQAFLPLIREARDRRIVNVSSVNGRLAWRYIGPYIASKHALEGLSDTLRMELHRWGIRVSVIQPGAIDTPMFETSRERGRRIAGDFSASAHELYGGLLRAIAERPGRAPKYAISPERVARVIHRALTARRPRIRYVVGWDAHLALLLTHLLPYRVLDWIMLRTH
jgi:NAD(P)-dependent dehydrogenase (short-subunit alcohol dehydrogenase family)